ncbi:hypothetical protein BABINDRAFT_172148 [Babjeviella inositovora NRRL Y-12698]|uniref:Amino acid permease/ SLC12A domain-containing protein n=1 Tax=Babjeviella inositovora NRRL Y-12698 TaxID=984486 RepID=A0A1E3QME8_9ASCO|nr:uncharacterized protein BABINDRAFT_172148 [Babjeviella inositovora NRRL Y-12698]ODQ78889.1 hypothetical protein BABINDRAFT_172148 [Babjeviella inositovora NRRL Y-12698]
MDLSKTIPPPYDEEKQVQASEPKITTVERGLKARHISMIAIGGTIGTGLFIGTAAPLSEAGPVSTLISYLFMGTLTFYMAQALGEMATFIPIAGSFNAFTTRFLSPALGGANGWLYWFTWAMTFALELTVVGDVIGFWTDAVPTGAWIAIFYVLLTAANFAPVRYYGEVEFWVAFIKVIAIVGWLIYCFIMVCGAGVTGPVGFRYWRNGNAWGPGILVKDKNTGRFLGWLSSLVNAAFTYQGVELVGVSSGESSNPRRTIPRAIRKVFYRILIFYVGGVLFIGLLVPYYDKKLVATDAAYTATSPFIIAIQNSGTPVLPDIFNAVILATIISAGNSNVYIGSRILYALAGVGNAPKWFGYTRNGVPYVGVLFTALFGLLAFLVLSDNGNKVFGWFLNITAVAGMICWVCISFSHIRFMQVLNSRNMDRNDLPFKAQHMPYGSWYAGIGILVIIFVQGFEVFFDFNANDFFVSYVSIVLFVVMWGFFQLFYGGPLLLPLDQIDIDSGRKEVDEMVWEEDDLPKNAWQKFWDKVS